MIRFTGIAVALGQAAQPTCTIDCANNTASGVSLLKQQVCQNAQDRMKDVLNHRFFIGSVKLTADVTCYPTFDLVSPSTDERTIFDANADGIRMVLAVEVWSQECGQLNKNECRAATSYSPCQWMPASNPPSGGTCVTDDSLCVKADTQSACENSNRCRWIEAADPETVSHVQCRFIRNWNELCGAYNSQARCATNSDHCKWSNATCVFNGCAHNADVKDPCACTVSKVDVRRSVRICSYGTKCLLADADSAMGAYAVGGGQCQDIPVAGPYCGPYFINVGCKPGATDGSASWRPNVLTHDTDLPTHEPWKTCCFKTCATWISDGNTCSDYKTPMPNVPCGETRTCSETVCCKPTCASNSFDCDAHKPSGVQAGTVLKSNAASISCPQDNSNPGTYTCDNQFRLCCELTCASIQGVCDTQIGGVTPTRNPNQASLLCSANPSGCDVHYCCYIQRTNCQEVANSNEARCGLGAYSQWQLVGNAASISCGSGPNYLCADPEHCCRRTCQSFLQSSPCPAGYDGSTNAAVECNGNCDHATCCVDTCANFDCTTSNGTQTGLTAKAHQGSIKCVNANECNHSRCCDVNCLAHQRRAPSVTNPQTCSGTGYSWRDNLAAIPCPGGSCSTNKDTCCKKTCEQFISTMPCAVGYEPNTANTNTVCGEIGGQACSQSLCCRPTCAAFFASSGCNSGPYQNGGWTQKNSSLPCAGATCNYLECCERDCAAYLQSTVTGGQSICVQQNKVASASVSLQICDNGCSADYCCAGTCLSEHTCSGAGISYKQGMRTTPCSGLTGGQCTAALCCAIDCSSFPEANCATGHVKNVATNNAVCVPTGPATGTISDCSSSQCCIPTCASYTCPSNYVAKNIELSSVHCSSGVCSPKLCCDTTCATYFGIGVCAATYERTRQPVSIKCDHSLNCAAICCLPTCATWFNAQNDGECGFTPYSYGGATYDKGLKKQGSDNFLCEENPNSNLCTQSYCCEPTCVQYFNDVCLSQNYVLNPTKASARCSDISASNGCTTGACCIEPCTTVSACPENEVQRTDSACNTLSTCNVHQCCICVTGSGSCLPSTGDPTNSCQVIATGYSSSEKKCRPIEACKEGVAVPTSCTCGGDVCVSQLNHFCHPSYASGSKCVPECVDGGNSPQCQCGSVVCAAESHCTRATSECFDCGSAVGICDPTHCLEVASSSGSGVVCVARTTSGASLIAQVGSGGGLGTLSVVGITLGCVALFAAAVTGAVYAKQKSSGGNTMFSGSTFADE